MQGFPILHLYFWIHINKYASLWLKKDKMLICHWSLKMKPSILAISQSFRFLEKRGFQCPLLPYWSQTSAAQAYFVKTMEYKDGKDSLGDESQWFIFWKLHPSPITHAKWGYVVNIILTYPDGLSPSRIVS